MTRAAALIRSNRALVLALGASLAGSIATCDAPSDVVVIGGKEFVEQDLFVELLAQVLEREGSIQVRRDPRRGGSMRVHDALRFDRIGAYVEYTGTADRVILQNDPSERRQPGPDELYRRVKEDYARRWDLVWLPRLGVDNRFVLVAREDSADARGWRDISDVASGGSWRIAFGPVFSQRPDGFDALVRRYGLRFHERIAGGEMSGRFELLEANEVDVLVANQTDGPLATGHFRILRDDLGFFAPYEAAPVVREDLLRRHPGLADALGRLEGSLTNETMRELVRQVEVEGRAVGPVIAEWLRAAEPGRSGGVHGG